MGGWDRVLEWGVDRIGWGCGMGGGGNVEAGVWSGVD